jgi:cytoskeletal protein CcmA (bactofilin family)
MLHSSDNAPKPQYTPSTQNPAAVKTMTAPIDQATIGRSVVIKGEISGAESLYIDGRIEGTVSFGDHRVTVGRNGVVAANISAREVVIMGKVTGNIECSDRVDIRSEGSLTGDIVSQRISIEDGAMLKGAVQVKSTEVRGDSKALSAAAGKSN